MDVDHESEIRFRPPGDVVMATRLRWLKCTGVAGRSRWLVAQSGGLTLDSAVCI